uniref:ATP synthase F0 subunit 8 n=1 Tax=Tarlina smithersi TaxID=1028202 RepID=H2E3M0_9ARAC|nr:ATP synthase F0 subunit 8 [Tarlina smithersi]
MPQLSPLMWIFSTIMIIMIMMMMNVLFFLKNSFINIYSFKYGFNNKKWYW